MPSGPAKHTYLSTLPRVLQYHFTKKWQMNRWSYRSQSQGPYNDSLATGVPSGYYPGMGKPEAEPQMPDQTKRLIAAILKVKPTADMPRPGAQRSEPKRTAKRKAKRSK